MGRTIFTNEEVDGLKKNPCVFSCTNNSVNYTYEFKKGALELHAQGITAREIWRRSGFDTTKWKGHYFRSTLSDWRSIVKKGSVESLLRVGGVQYDKGPNDTNKDKIKRLELQVKYLKAENDFLAKLRAKRAERNSGHTRNTESSTNWDSK